jgi:hypothetical protein
VTPDSYAKLGQVADNQLEILQNMGMRLDYSKSLAQIFGSQSAESEAQQRSFERYRRAFELRSVIIFLSADNRQRFAPNPLNPND